MKLYISDISECDFDIQSLGDVEIIPDINQADVVLILPGGLGTFNDLFQAISLKKKVIVYNKDLYYSSLFKNLFQGYEKGYIEVAPSEYVSIESEQENIVKKIGGLRK